MVVVAIEFNDLRSESVKRGQALKYLSLNLASVPIERSALVFLLEKP
jgi:hypothetical protein